MKLSNTAHRTRIFCLSLVAFSYCICDMPFSQGNRVVINSLQNKFLSAHSFSSTPDNKYFVVDLRNQSVTKISVEGNIEKSIGGQGWGNYEFDYPTDVSASFLLDIYVTDFNNRRIQRYDSRLNFVQTIDGDALSSDVGRFYPKACAISSLGNLFVIETDGRRILKLNKRCQLEREFGTYKDGSGALTDPKDIAISATDEIFVLDGLRVVAYDIFGNYMRTILLPQDTWKSVQVSGNTLIVTSSHAIMIYSLDGSVLQTIHHDSIIGISSTEEFVDSVVIDDRLVILTSTSLYFCSFQ